MTSNTTINDAVNTAPGDIPERKELDDPRSRRFKARNDKTMPLPGDPGNMQALNQPDNDPKTAGLPETKSIPGADGNTDQNQTNENDLMGGETYSAVYVREDGEEVLLGAIVQDAFKESGAESPKAWNDLSQDQRNESIDAVIEEQGLTPKEDVDAESEQDSDPDEDFGDEEAEGDDGDEEDDNQE